LHGYAVKNITHTASKTCVELLLLVKLSKLHIHYELDMVTQWYDCHYTLLNPYGHGWVTGGRQAQLLQGSWFGEAHT